nr:hypothetical protein [Tanacetum cinerariifolium]
MQKLKSFQIWGFGLVDMISRIVGALVEPTPVAVEEDADNDADKEMFDVDALNSEEVFVAEQEVVNAATTTTATVMTVDDVTLAQALMEIKSIKPKEKEIIFQEPGKFTTTTKIIYSQQSQDKGKGMMIEEPVKKKHQIMLDAEATKKLQAEFDEEERRAREKAEKEQEANIDLIEEWDHIQAKIDADHQSAKRMQAQEQEELAFKRVNTFEYFKTELVKEKENRAGEELIQDSTKKQKVKDDKETSELKQLMKITTYKEEVAIDDIPLAVKSLRIVD